MHILPSSFRDPSGFVFTHLSVVFRAIHSIYKPHFELLMNNGLYEKLTNQNLLIKHKEVNNFTTYNDIYKIIKPDQITTISYAYEWSFTMLQDAAICTLNNALLGLEHGMILKDANTFNIQFLDGKPILIDSLSFEKYVENESWIAYRQFCECFLAPLLMMKYCHSSLNKLLIAYPNGIPLSICKSMLPFSARFNIHIYLHVFLQSHVSEKKEEKSNSNKPFSKQKLMTLLQGLKDFVKNLKPENVKTTWDNYYTGTILSNAYLQEKKKIVSSMLASISFQTMLDLGANDGEFSLLYKNTDKNIIALDEDRNCIEHLYTYCKKNKITNVVPLIMDLTTPSPSIGWVNKERNSIFDRVKPDVTLSLALMHHLCIANNITLKQLVDFFYSLSEFVIVEFVDKADEKVIELLKHRKDIFTEYSLDFFKKYISEKFEIIREEKLIHAQRTLFLLKRN